MMLYLQLLLNRLSTEEIAQLQQLNKTNIESKVFQYILEKKQQELPKITAMAKDLEMSSAHFRKASSTLVQKCYQELNDDQDIILYLCSKNLHINAMHEIKKEEKRLLKSGNTGALSLLYYSTTKLFMNADFSDYDDDFIHDTIQKFEVLCPDRPEKSLIMKIQAAFMKINRIVATPIPNEAERNKIQRQFEQDFKNFEHLLAHRIIPELQFEAKWWVLYFEAEYYYRVALEIEKCTALYLDMIELYEQNKHKNVFGNSHKINPSLRISLIQYRHSKFEEAFQQIHQLFEEFPDIFRRNLFWVDMLVQLSITLEKFDFAKRLIFKYRPHDAQNPGTFYQVNDDVAMYLASIELLNGQYEDAFWKIQEAKIGLDKSSFFWIDTRLRLLENTYFFLIGEEVIADDLVTKNLKFYNYHKEKKDISLFKDFHRIIRFYIRNPFQNKELPSDLKTSFNKWQKGEFAFLGKLLELIRNSRNPQNQNT